MQQFVVPQFIDVEDRIIGPITTRQFLEMMSAMFICFVAYKLADFTLFLTIAIITIFVTVVLAFMKVNGRPFHFFVVNVVQTSKRPNLRRWNKALNTVDLRRLSNKDMKIKTAKSIAEERMIGRSRLSDLSLIVDTGGIYKGGLNEK